MQSLNFSEKIIENTKKQGKNAILVVGEEPVTKKHINNILQKFSVNITSISVMAVPILAVLIDYIIIDVAFSIFDLLALICIVTGIFVAAKKPFNN